MVIRFFTFYLVLNVQQILSTKSKALPLTVQDLVVEFIAGRVSQQAVA